MALALALGGCAHGVTRSVPSPDVESLQQRLGEAQAREADLQRKVDELQNRVFILQDQLEVREVQAQKRAAPHLPVEVRPEREPAPTDSDIEYAGAARDATAPRPVLRLVGSQAPQLQEVAPANPPSTGAATPRRAGRSAPRPEWRPPEPMGSDDRLPVTRGVPPVPKPGAPSMPAKIEPTPAAPAAAHVPAAPAAAAVPAAAPLSAMKLYTQSIDLLHQGKHAEAISGLRKFIATYPSHDYADNAQYWLGECYYDQKDYSSALREFRRVVEKYPSGNKAPDALLKVGFTYRQLNEAGKARDVLEQLVKSYPGTDVAKKASERLQEWK
jgi:tol-pal system protein YbgF